MSRYPEDLQRALFKSTELDIIVGKENLMELNALYSTDLRVYHNWDHALDVLMATTWLRLPFSYLRRAYYLAAIFHDVVYNAGNPLNEAQSVLLMRRMVRGWDTEVGHATHLIMLTKMHLTSSVDNVDEEFRDFLDCDLLTFASRPWELAVEYDYAVCAELVLAGQTEENIVLNRGLFLMSMLAKPSIFIGGQLGPTHEWHARQNMHKLISYRHDFSQLKVP